MRSVRSRDGLWLLRHGKPQPGQHRKVHHSCMRAAHFSSSSSAAGTFSAVAISQMLETVASSMDMVLRFGRSVLMELSASTHAPACSLRQFARSHKTCNQSSMICCEPLRVTWRVGCCEAVPRIRSHSLLAYPVRSDTAPRGWSVPSRPPAQRLFRTLPHGHPSTYVVMV